MKKNYKVLKLTKEYDKHIKWLKDNEKYITYNMNLQCPITILRIGDHVEWVADRNKEVGRLIGKYKRMSNKWNKEQLEKDMEWLKNREPTRNDTVLMSIKKARRTLDRDYDYRCEYGI